MRITVTDFGPIRKAELAADKPLTIFCGPNSTGKTYIAYLLYAIYSSNYVYTPDFYDTIKHDIESEGSFTLRKEYIDSFLKALAEQILRTLNVIFGLSEREVSTLFPKAKLQLSFSDAEYSQLIDSVSYSITFGSSDYRTSLSKAKHSDRIEYNKEILTDKSSDEALQQMLPTMLSRMLKHFGFNGPSFARMLTVERNSIYTFKNELALSRSSLTEGVYYYENTDGSQPKYRQSNRLYPLAIKDSLSIANDLEEVQKYKSDYAEIAKEIEEKLLDGRIEFGKNGEVEFLSNKAAKTQRLPIHMSSSIVKTLSSMIVYLKYLAHQGDVLIIDEPEMNLHPDNQVLLSRIFSLLVNKGLRLIISTHSDYVVREFNNLVMAYSLRQSQADHIVDDTYQDNVLISPDNMQVLYFTYKTTRKVDTKLLPVDKYGFEVPSIDDTIKRQNSTTEDLFDALAY